MSFTPPRCPNRSCLLHTVPHPRFYWRNGTYTPDCRAEPQPRFKCRNCRRSFSRQTFRQDYCDRRPASNQALFHLLTSGTGLRQAGRVLGLAPSSVQHKMRKMARSCRWLQRNLARRLPAGRTYLLDEEETYARASIRTLTVPIVMEKESWFLVAATAGPIRRLARKGSKRRMWQDHDERRHGRRRDRSRSCVRGVLARLERMVPDGPITLLTDEKSSYATLAKERFGARLQHVTTAGTAARTTRNPLFPINTTIAMSRDNMGRLRRKSWLVSKSPSRLRGHLQIFLVYRNFVRQRFNRDGDRNITAATSLGLVPRALRVSEVLRWRQDWGDLSPHPLSFGAESTVRQEFSESV